MQDTPQHGTLLRQPAKLLSTSSLLTARCQVHNCCDIEISAEMLEPLDRNRPNPSESKLHVCCVLCKLLA